MTLVSWSSLGHATFGNTSGGANVANPNSIVVRYFDPARALYWMPGAYERATIRRGIWLTVAQNRRCPSNETHRIMTAPSLMLERELSMSCCTRSRSHLTRCVIDPTRIPILCRRASQSVGKRRRSMGAIHHTS
jgi:hypothetical protein